MSISSENSYLSLLVLNVLLQLDSFVFNNNVVIQYINYPRELFEMYVFLYIY